MICPHCGKRYDQLEATFRQNYLQPVNATAGAPQPVVLKVDHTAAMAPPPTFWWMTVNT